MILRIDTTSSTPVYDQIVEQTKRAVASGAIRPGDALPSLREAARTLRINPLTVAKAYKQLEQDGVIETRHGLGSGTVRNPAMRLSRKTLIGFSNSRICFLRKTHTRFLSSCRQWMGEARTEPSVT